MDSKHKLLLAVGITAIVTDMLPTPADYFVFKAEQKNKEKLEKKEITPKQFWQRSAAWYYLANPAYWALVTLAVMTTKADYNTKVKIGLGLVAAGAVVGVISRNIKKDNELLNA